MLTTLILTSLFCSTYEFTHDYRVMDTNGNRTSIYNGLYYRIKNLEDDGLIWYFSLEPTKRDPSYKQAKNWVKMKQDSRNNAEFEFYNNQVYPFNLTEYSENYYLIGKI